MPGTTAPSRARFDGALPLAMMMAVALAVPFLHPLAYALASLYLIFATGMASDACHRDDEPTLPWRLYALAAAVLTVVVPLIGLMPWLRSLLVLPLAMFGTGLIVHIGVKCRYGIVRVGLLSACGRRRHDARVGRTLELTTLALAAGTLMRGPASVALFAFAAWLLAAAAVYERPEPGDTNWILKDQPDYATAIAT